MCITVYCMCLFKDLSGQQQPSSSESDFQTDFPQHDSEFREEGIDFTEDYLGSADGAAYSSAAETSHVSGKKSMFEGYKDPSKQFSGQTRSYHHDARY